MITTPQQTSEVIASESADLVLLAREHLRDPYFTLHAGQALGAAIQPPVRYGRGFAK